MAVSLGELAVRFGCELRGDPETRVERVGDAGECGRALARLPRQPALPRAAGRHARRRGGARARAAPPTARAALLLCDNPYATYARIAALLHPAPPLAPGVHPTARGGRGARIDPSAEIGALAVVGAGTQRRRARLRRPALRAWTQDVTLGEDVRLVARVTLGRGVADRRAQRAAAGRRDRRRRLRLRARARRWVKVPQVGGVRIGADVEIGANTTIDRGAIEDTVIEEGVKLDNLIQIGHNVRIGAHTVDRRLHRHLRQHHHRQALHDRRRGRHRRPPHDRATTW